MTGTAVASLGSGITEPSAAAVTAAPDAEVVLPSRLATPSGPAPATTAVALGARFLEAVRGELPEVAIDMRNEEIAEMGGQACASLAAGQPRRAVADELTEYGLTGTDARRLVTLARTTLCRA